MRTVTLAFLGLLVSASTAFADGPPLPPDVLIVAPDPGVPADMANFSGTWSGGKWDDMLDTALVVERIQPSGVARVIYAWGDYAPWGTVRGWARYSAIIDNGTLRFAIPRQGNPSETFDTVTYRMDGDGTLEGIYSIYVRNMVDRVILHRE